ncbi:hypothetical protein Mapa_003272 [Marchantia paleacea]|nr:hypothetical protein Mapa_003272 [Marchantia paleacea]
MQIEPLWWDLYPPYLPGRTQSTAMKRLTEYFSSAIIRPHHECLTEISQVYTHRRLFTTCPQFSRVFMKTLELHRCHHQHLMRLLPETDSYIISSDMSKSGVRGDLTCQLISSWMRAGYHRPEWNGSRHCTTVAELDEIFDRRQ